MQAWLYTGAECNIMSIVVLTPPFVQHMFVPWSSHKLEVFLACWVNVNGILSTVWLRDLDIMISVGVGSTCNLISYL